MKLLFHCFLIVGIVSTIASAATENLLRDSGFDRRSTEWSASGGKGTYTFQSEGGRSGGCLRYQKAPESTSVENVHFDQTAEVSPGAAYVAEIWVKGDGTLRPVLRVASEDWQTLAAAMATPEPEWQLLRVTFETGTHRMVRFQLFGGSISEHRETLPGSSWFDDASLRKATPSEVAALHQCRIVVDPSKVLREIDPLFFGVNTLFWIEDDASLRDGAIAKRLREMPCRLMRFPGGTAGENYHWRTGSLENHKRYPFKDGPAMLDTDEFMKLCRQVGAEPMLVVNLETSFLAGNLDAGIREACEWVRYCNQEKGYNVRYWEIGNEQYLLTNMTAEQYGNAFVRFARAMKAVDPTICIGATGPENIAGAGAADRVPQAELKQVQLLPESQRANAIKELKRSHRKGPAWWPILFRTAGAEMDMAVIHNYFSATSDRALGMDREVAELRRTLREQFPNHSVRIALTEWNLGKSVDVSPAEQAMIHAEAIMRYIEGGVDLATFWPLRFPGREWGDRSLLDLQTNAPLPSYEVMKCFSTNAGASLLKSESGKAFVHTFATRSANGKTLELFVVNRSGHKDGIEMDLSLGNLTANFHRGQIFDGSGTHELTPKPADKSWRWLQPAQSLALIRFASH